MFPGKIVKPSIEPRGINPASSFDLWFPKILDFKENPEQTVSFFKQLNDLIYKVKAARIRIDHSTIEKVSAEAALVLIAEVGRAKRVRPFCSMRGTPARSSEVHEFLGLIGYWTYFKNIEWKPSETRSRHFLHHRTGDQTTGSVVKELIALFFPEANLTKEGEKALYAAIIECMDNVMKHAYDETSHRPVLKDTWWMLGYRDTKTHEISFCFYDQGRGIPRTIRTRWKDRLGPMSMSDSEIVRRAVIDGHYSSTKDPTRGRGLPTLKRFIDMANTGELMIVSRSSRCIFRRDGFDALAMGEELRGTLIAWAIAR